MDASRRSLRHAACRCWHENCMAIFPPTHASFPRSLRSVTRIALRRPALARRPPAMRAPSLRYALQIKLPCSVRFGQCCPRFARAPRPGERGPIRPRTSRPGPLMFAAPGARRLSAASLRFAAAPLRWACAARCALLRGWPFRAPLPGPSLRSPCSARPKRAGMGAHVFFALGLENPRSHSTYPPLPFGAGCAVPSRGGPLSPAARCALAGSPAALPRAPGRPAHNARELRALDRASNGMQGDRWDCQNMRTK